MISGKEEKLIYDLIFSDTSEFIIKIEEYCAIQNYDEFVDKIRNILRKSKVSIISNSLDVGDKSVVWRLKVRK
jgi:hypothetical protein